MVNDGRVNFIIHLKVVLPIMFADSGLKAVDIFLYMSLFIKWNSTGFRCPLTIRRQDIQGVSKVSDDCYSPSLRRLHDAGYLRYAEGKNGTKPAVIAMIRFDQKNEAWDSIKSITVPNSGRYIPDFPHAAIRDIGTIEKQKENYKQKINESFNQKNEGQGIKDDAAAILRAGLSNSDSAPDDKDVLAFFLSIGSEESVAQKFYEWNDERNWSLSETSKDWKDHARTWIKNSLKFKKNKIKKSPHDVSAPIDKKYNEPL